MTPLRLAARCLRVRSSSSSTASCTSCEAPAGTSSSSFPLNTSSPLSWKPSPSCAPVSGLVEEKSFQKPLGIFSHRAATAVARESSSWHTQASRSPVDRVYLSGSSAIRDPHHDLIGGVQPRVSSLGQRPRNGCSLHSFSVVYSNFTTTDSEHDVPDGQQQHQQAIPNSLRSENSAVSPSLLKCEEEEEETEVVDDGEEFFSEDDNTPASGNSRRSTTVLYEDEEEEVAPEWDASLLTSTDDESDLSELESVEVNRHPEGLDDSELEAGDSRPEEEEDTQWTGSISERVPLEASTGKEEGTSEHFSDFLDVVSTTAEDFREGGLTDSESHGDDHHDGLPYLHTLSVDEVREILEKARAKDVSTLEVRKCCEWVDHLIFASGRSSRHLRGMADAIVYKVKQLSENVGPNSYPLVEGRDGEQWMAIDCGNIVIHLFLEEARSYYNLEEFWSKKSNPRLVETY